MSEYNENDWGTKKMKYYQMNKREDNSDENDSDFIEEEKEAIRLQKLKLEKIKKAKLLREDEEDEDDESQEKKDVKKDIKKDKENKIENDISLKTLEKDNKKIIENINLLKNCLEEYQTVNDEINILDENKKLNLPNTISYLKEYKKLNLLYSANILFNIISTLNNKMTGHHPSIKNSAIFNFLLNKNTEKNEQIQNNIEKILISLKNKNKKNNLEDKEEKEENEIVEEEEDEEDEDNLDIGEDDIDEEVGLEEEVDGGEEYEKKDKNKQLISNNLIGNINGIKKPSFLNKKKKRNNIDEEADIKEKEDFDKDKNISCNKDEEQGEKEEEDDEDDSFIKEQYKSFNKLKKEKEVLDKQKKENEKKDIEMKNNLAIRKANKQVLEAKGITRKRKRYQGNAKLMNREKFYKKEKQRQKMVKDYIGKPDVYTGEATGIRRDLIRSTKIH